MDPKNSIKPLLSATAISTGGRNGHAATTDKSVDVNLSVRKEMGGPGLPDTTTPEHLFAAGYAACFGGALDFVGTQHKVDTKGTVTTCEVAIGPRQESGFGIGVKMHVKSTTIPQAQLEQLVNETHDKICPYSHATRGNIPFELVIEGA
jgi:Ohr subfamily peroxiredoxin